MGKGKKMKVGKVTKVAIEEITDDPFTSAFGGKAVMLLPLIEALTVLAEEVEAVSPSKMNTIAWAVIKDGHVVVADIEEEEEELEPWTEEELGELGASKLREEAKFLKVRLTKTRGGKSGKLNKKTRAALIEAILEAQVEYFGIEREEEEEDDDDEEYVPWTRKDLKGAVKDPEDEEDLSFEDLIDIADDLGVELTKKEKNAVLKRGRLGGIINDILEAQDAMEEDDDDDDEEEDDDEEAVELYTKSELKGMSQEELAEIADEWDLEVKKPTKKKLMTAILKFQKEEL